MANKTELDSRSIQISKDVQGPDVPIPLSPQWLLPKSVEKSKEIGPHQGSANRSDISKSPGNAEELLDNHKKDVFRPSVLDMESGRRDRWRDEERDTNSSVRRDRWRDGDKELGDNRKVDRWTESSGRPYGEGRRAPPERWTDSGNKEGTQDQRRENKWNNRWGTDDKEPYSAGREKWASSTKDADTFLDKGSSNLPYDGKDEREGDHYRPWRPSNRGRGEPPHNQALTPNKPTPSFSHGRGRGESPGNSFSLGRGNFGSGGSSMNDVSHLQRFGSFSEKVEDAHGDPSLLRYNRTKLLDIYRVTDMRSCEKFLDGAVQVPSLTEEEPVQPLALYGPTPEELVILKGIDKGDIVSSGAPQTTKDGPNNRNSTDFMHSRKSNSGSREDSPFTVDDSKDGTVDNAKDNYFYDKQTHTHLPNARVEALSRTSSDNKFHSEASGEDSRSYRKNDDAPVSREPMLQGNTSIPHGGMWRSPSIERANSASRDLRERSAEMGSRTSEASWRQTQKDLNNEWENSLADSPYTKREGYKWQTSTDPILKRQNSSVLEKESETYKQLSQPSPEDLVLYYIDPQGKTQGPFSGIDIIGWFETGYLGIDLPVRLANAPPNSPFSALGDVMPHLRAKAGPPPGFGAAPMAELTDASGGSSFSTSGKLHGGSSDINMVNNDPRYVHGSAKDAENRYLESLMAGNKGGGPLSEGVAGMQGYRGNNSGALPPLGAENGDNSYLYAQKLALERQRSLSNPYSYWPGRDVSPITSKPEIMQDSTLQNPNILSSIVNNALLQQQPLSQNIDLMSMLQGVRDRSNAGVNNGVSGWSNFPLQGQDKLDMHQGQNFPLQAGFGMQQQRLQPQNPPSFTNMFPQVVDNSASMLTPEKLLSSGLSQDPQLLSLLEQQYLMQLQSPSTVTSQPMSLLDKLLLLKQQQQKQEEQQQLLRQQQQLLSQMLSGQHAQQRLAEPSYEQLRSAGLSSGNASMDHPRFQPSPEMFQIGSQTQLPILQDEQRMSNFGVPSNVSRDATHVVGSETSSIPLPHQLSGNTNQPRSWTDSLPEQFGSMPQRGSLETTTIMNSLPQPEMPKISPLDQTLQSNKSSEVAIAEAAPSVPPEVILEQSSLVSCKNELLIPEQVNNAVTTLLGKLDELLAEGERLNIESSVANKAKNAETREVKKSEKKSKKSKASKAQSSDAAKKAAKTDLSKSSEIEVTNSNDVKPEMQSVSEESKNIVTVDNMDTQVLPNHPSLQGGESVTQLSSGQRAWKPAPGFKPKSLLEIQLEEQKRAQTETEVSEISTSLSSMNVVSTPWSGVVANSDNKSFREIQQDTGSIESLMKKPDSSLDNKSKKSQTHNLPAENIMSKSIEREVVISDTVSSKPSASVVDTQYDFVDNDDFIKAKDTKKNRKKAAKAKGAGSKVSAPAASPDVSVGPSPILKGKTSRQVQQEKEVLPAAPSGPSLGDFVVWKGESANVSPAPPAWSSDSGNLSKPTSLRDILKEQERKIPTEKKQTVQTPQKSAPNQPARGGGSSWSSSAPAPPKAATPVHINSQTALHSKNSVDDDLFWGPIGHSKQEAKPYDFPQLGNKDVPSKGAPGKSLSKQKSVSGRDSEYTYSSSPASAQSTKKGKKGALTKQSEAVDFREWCESECVRLIGTKDTSFLEFCLKQSRSEAETLLIENLGSFDPDHVFIEKFLNYKDFLSVDVLEMAFQTENNRKVTGSVANDMTSTVGFGGSDSNNKGTAPDGTSKGDGKKKGNKKGKKVSPLVLGFNVVSNRIMMGEIQTIED